MRDACGGGGFRGNPALGHGEAGFPAHDAAVETTDVDHGRSETRRHVVFHDVDWLVSHRRYPGLKAIAMVEAEVGRGDTISVERRDFLSSFPLDAALFSRAVRPIGASRTAFTVLDVVFHDDLMRLRTENGPQNMATIKHMAMNLIRNASDKDSLKTRRKAAASNHEYIRAIVTQIA